MKVLLLEENKRIRDLIAEFLSDDGHEVIACADSETALEDVDSSKPDMMLISPNVARNSGLELLYEVVSYPDLSSVESVLLVDRPDMYMDHQATLKELNVRLVLARSQLSKSQVLSAVDHIGADEKAD